VIGKRPLKDRGHCVGDTEIGKQKTDEGIGRWGDREIGRQRDKRHQDTKTPRRGETETRRWGVREKRANSE